MPTPRFPLQEAPEPRSSRQLMEDALHTMHGGSPPFQWVENNGESHIGCYAPLSYTPTMTAHFFQLAKLVYLPSTVKPRNRELAILALFSELRAPYAVYCHRGVAEKVGLTGEQYEEGLKGTVPRGLSREEEMAYRLGKVLTTMTGPLGEEVWQEARGCLGREEVVGIVHLIAGYRWVAMLEQVNGEDERWEH
ncbi:hypothetical protein QBC40DRAFT_199741 [Triangularia verruculosa]|uniref:Carboxymuconolactone decarboxylase-like domain-containing protein n=1 Tax=Triangularia verruculosa TaxID=2587418 RepID=A0AAN6XHB1_9PEZI|nr:hypothetical protein QBC40DRAFT_199741 [Triangularia verruculosa]